MPSKVVIELSDKIMPLYTRQRLDLVQFYSTYACQKILLTGTEDYNSGQHSGFGITVFYFTTNPVDSSTADCMLLSNEV
jgi:hypothetical protein